MDEIDWVLFIQIVAALGTTAAAVAAFLAARETQKAAQAQLMSSLLERLYSEDAIHSTTELYVKRGNLGAEAFAKWVTTANNSKDSGLDRMMGLTEHIHLLSRAGMLTKQQAKLLVSESRAYNLLVIFAPLPWGGEPVSFLKSLYKDLEKLPPPGPAKT